MQPQVIWFASLRKMGYTKWKPLFILTKVLKKYETELHLTGNRFVLWSIFFTFPYYSICDVDCKSKVYFYFKTKTIDLRSWCLRTRYVVQLGAIVHGEVADWCPGGSYEFFFVRQRPWLPRWTTTKRSQARRNSYIYNRPIFLSCWCNLWLYVSTAPAMWDFPSAELSVYVIIISIYKN